VKTGTDRSYIESAMVFEALWLRAAAIVTPPRLQRPAARINPSIGSSCSGTFSAGA
jgi:hypothetical protein